MMTVEIAGIGVSGPGLHGWEAAADVLSGRKSYDPSDMVIDAPRILSERERRRSSPTMRLALHTALEAVERSGLAPETLAVVFASANSDGLVLHSLLESLSRHPTAVSPTQFHNSVHNAAAGYWSIGVRARTPSTCISAHDYSFGAALLKGAAEVVSENQPVLITAYDSPFLEPLNAKRPLSAPFAVALVLVPSDTGRRYEQMSVDWRAGPAPAPTVPKIESLRTLWSGNPAARALPLLEALATGSRDPVVIDFPDDGHLSISVI
jgi:Beta-ketoacyl synthase, N-terminal domain